MMAQAEQPMRARMVGKTWRLPLRDWKIAAIRSWHEQAEDNISLIAAGVAFYGFLALVPLLAATTLTYGLIASPQTVIDNVRHLMAVMPASAAKLIGEQLMQVVDTSGGKKGLGLVVALAIALFGARNGAGALIVALNVAYEQEETRSYVRVTLLALAMTAAGVLFAIVAALAIAVIGFIEDLIPFATGFVALVGKALTYALLAAAGAAMAATLYRFGPARHHGAWEWLTPGSLLATAGWVVLTLGFGLYVSRFGHYNATYGSLSAVIVLLTWLYLSSYLLLLGAELNSELEKLLERRAPNGKAPALRD
jgi:membrane protein